MKLFAIIITAFFALSAQAEQLRPEMQQQLIKQLKSMDSQQLQNQLGEMQSCVSKHRDSLAALETKGQAIAAEVEALCTVGERAKAQAYAKLEGNKFLQDPAIKTVQRCSKALAKQLQVRSQLKPMPNQHICCLLYTSPSPRDRG